MKKDVTGDSFVLSLVSESQDRRSFRQLINDLRVKRPMPGTPKAEELGATIERTLARFDTLPKDRYPDWEWDLYVMKSWAESTFKNYREAVEWEKRALGLAVRPDQRARNLNNLSDHFVRLGEYETAIDFALQAFDLWPDNEGIVCNLALALAKAGRIRDSSALIAHLADGADIDRQAKHTRSSSATRETSAGGGPYAARLTSCKIGILGFMYLRTTVRSARR